MNDIAAFVIISFMWLIAIVSLCNAFLPKGRSWRTWEMVVATLVSGPAAWLIMLLMFGYEWYHKLMAKVDD